MAAGNVWIVAGNDRCPRAREVLEHVEGGVHPLEVVHHREGSFELELLVEVNGIGREHDAFRPRPRPP